MNDGIVTGRDGGPRNDTQTEFVRRMRAWQRMFAWPQIAPILTVVQMARELKMPLATMRRWVRDYVDVGLLRPGSRYGTYEIAELGIAAREIVRRSFGVLGMNHPTVSR